MFFENNIVGLSIVLAIFGTFIGISRKYHLTKIGVNALTLLDIIITNSILLTYIFYNTTLTDLKDSFNKLTVYDFIMCIIVSMLIAFSVIIGRSLLLNNDISTLTLIHTIINIILSVLLGYLIYNEKITLNKTIGIIFVIIGSFFIHR
jgi:uncharacterized membrane protein